MPTETYPEKFHRLQLLAAKLSHEIPETMKGFSQLHARSLTDGALNRKTKELMALAISIASPCTGCIAYHVHDALNAGSTREEILETIGVSVMMGGGPGLIYGLEALEALMQFEAKK